MAALDVGDSFLIPGLKSASTVYSQKKSMPKGRVYVARVSSAGVRVWRAE